MQTGSLKLGKMYFFLFLLLFVLQDAENQSRLQGDGARE